VSPIDAANPDTLPEQQLEQLMQTGIPTLAFFHSNNCEQCLQMVEIVEKVYTEFTPSVGLVDVNVYDERNASLLQMARISVIPTLVFFDSKGQGEVFMGVMQPEQLRERLRALGGR
jgi:thioredoxin-like negative regulator of GroEL